MKGLHAFAVFLKRSCVLVHLSNVCTVVRSRESTDVSKRLSWLLFI